MTTPPSLSTSGKSKIFTPRRKVPTSFSASPAEKISRPFKYIFSFTFNVPLIATL